MKKNEIPKCLDYLDPSLIEEAENISLKRKTPLYKYIAAAASAAIIIAVALAVIPLFNNDIVSPPEESAAVIEESKEEPSEAFELDVSGVLDYEVKEDGSIIYTVGEETEDGITIEYVKVATGYLACSSLSAEAVEIQTTVDKEKFWNEHNYITVREINSFYRGKKEIVYYKASITYSGSETSDISEAEVLDYYNCGIDNCDFILKRTDSEFILHGVIGCECAPFTLILTAYDKNDSVVWELKKGLYYDKETSFIKCSKTEKYISADEISVSDFRLDETAQTKDLVISHAATLSGENRIRATTELEYVYYENRVAIDENGIIYDFGCDVIRPDTGETIIESIPNGYASKALITNGKICIGVADGRVYTFSAYDGSLSAAFDYRHELDETVNIYADSDGEPYIAVIGAERKETFYYSTDGMPICETDERFAKLVIKYQNDGGAYKLFFRDKPINTSDTVVISDGEKVVFDNKYYFYMQPGQYYDVNSFILYCNSEGNVDGMIFYGYEFRKGGTNKLTVGNTVFEGMESYKFVPSSSAEMYLIINYMDRDEIYRITPGFDAELFEQTVDGINDQNSRK